MRSMWLGQTKGGRARGGGGGGTNCVWGNKARTNLHFAGRRSSDYIPLRYDQAMVSKKVSLAPVIGSGSALMPTHAPANISQILSEQQPEPRLQLQLLQLPVQSNQTLAPNLGSTAEQSKVL